MWAWAVATLLSGAGACRRLFWFSVFCDRCPTTYCRWKLGPNVFCTCEHQQRLLALCLLLAVYCSTFWQRALAVCVGMHVFWLWIWYDALKQKIVKQRIQFNINHLAPKSCFWAKQGRWVYWSYNSTRKTISDSHYDGNHFGSFVFSDLLGNKISNSLFQSITCFGIQPWSHALNDCIQ